MNDILGSIGKAIGLVSEAVQDPDKANAIIGHLEAGRQAAYLAELNTQTVPWVDALHKMGRQLLSWGNMGICAYIVAKHPEVNPLTLAAVAGPTGIYSMVKGKGR